MEKDLCTREEDSCTREENSCTSHPSHPSDAAMPPALENDPEDMVVEEEACGAFHGAEAAAEPAAAEEVAHGGGDEGQIRAAGEGDRLPLASGRSERAGPEKGANHGKCQGQGESPGCGVDERECGCVEVEDGGTSEHSGEGAACKKDPAIASIEDECEACDASAMTVDDAAQGVAGHPTSHDDAGSAQIETGTDEGEGYVDVCCISKGTGLFKAMNDVHEEEEKNQGGEEESGTQVAGSGNVEGGGGTVEGAGEAGGLEDKMEVQDKLVAVSVKDIDEEGGAGEAVKTTEEGRVEEVEEVEGVVKGTVEAMTEEEEEEEEKEEEEGGRGGTTAEETSTVDGKTGERGERKEGGESGGGGEGGARGEGGSVECMQQSKSEEDLCTSGGREGNVSTKHLSTETCQQDAEEHSCRREEGLVNGSCASEKGLAKGSCTKKQEDSCPIGEGIVKAKAEKDVGGGMGMWAGVGRGGGGGGVGGGRPGAGGAQQVCDV
jgi:hypothetical protein